MRQSIAVRIIATAIGLVALMGLASGMSFYLARQVGGRIDRLTGDYIPAYGDLARANVRSLGQALALRRMFIEGSAQTIDQTAVEANRKVFDTEGTEFTAELRDARKRINAEIDRGDTFADPAGLARLDTRITALIEEDQPRYSAEATPLTGAGGVGVPRAGAVAMARVDNLRDAMDGKLESIRREMMGLMAAAAARTRHEQNEMVAISAILTVLAAIFGLVCATLISTGLVRPLRRLLEGAVAVERGRLDVVVEVGTRDEVGDLTIAFNSMTEQLRVKERIRETFGKYIDPRVVEGIIDRPAIAQSEGQRRTMTVMFSDMVGFTSLGEGMTPQGLVKVMNCYLTTMSEPIREQRGVIDKYIGDAIMAYWGPPFTENEEQAGLACLAALDMIDRLGALRADIVDLMGIRDLPRIDMRIGVATGDALVGNLGSEFMMSYTVMGDAVNVASRLEGANKTYGTRILASGATAAAAARVVETREIDRLMVVGKSESVSIHEVMARTGELSPAQAALREAFAEGLEAYRTGEWPLADRCIGRCLEIMPGDGPAITLQRRIAQMIAAPKADDWNGVWAMEMK
jgi:class 3 adenylate cyclase